MRNKEKNIKANQFCKYLKDDKGLVKIDILEFEKNNFKLSPNEINMLNELELTPFPEKAFFKVNRIQSNGFILIHIEDKEEIVLDPISVAIYDIIRGIEIIGKDKAKKLDPNLESIDFTAREFFKKYKPMVFQLLCR